MQSNTLGQSVGRSGKRFFILETTLGSHVPEDMLMGYSSGHLPDRALAGLEEHILMCEACQLHLQAIDEHMLIAAQAVKEVREERKAIKKVRTPGWLFGTPKIIWAMGLATAIVCVVTPLLRPGATLQRPPTEVSLTASRGSIQALVAHPQAGKLTLKIDTSELLNLPAYQLQLVDAAGREIWSGPAPNLQQQIRVALPDPLRSGQYWVRLWTPEHIQVREFGLAIE